MHAGHGCLAFAQGQLVNLMDRQSQTGKHWDRPASNQKAVAANPDPHSLLSECITVPLKAEQEKLAGLSPGRMTRYSDNHLLAPIT